MPLNADEGIIKPMKNKSDPDMMGDVIMMMVSSDIDYWIHQKSHLEVTPYDLGFFHFYQIKTKAHSHIKIAGPFLGAPQAVMGLEKIIALGGRRMWVLGWCGSLSQELQIGSLLIPTSAVSEEGTSAQYPVDHDLMSDMELNRRLEHSLCEKGYTFKSGPVWTTDAPYRETPSKVQKYKEQGVLGVEMEMSALMAVSIFRRVQMAGILVVSDELFNLKWNPGFSDPRLRRGSKIAGEIIFNLAESIT